VKYDRKLITEFPAESCVMCVYCHTEQREDVWTVLSSLESRQSLDVRTRDAREMASRRSQSGEMIQGRNMDPEQAERVRIGAREIQADVPE